MPGPVRKWPASTGNQLLVFTGEAVHAYLGQLPDQEIEAMLNELAVELGAALGQEGSMWRFATGPGMTPTPASARVSGDLRGNLEQAPYCDRVILCPCGF